jgi:hypothetical protein
VWLWVWFEIFPSMWSNTATTLSIQLPFHRFFSSFSFFVFFSFSFFIFIFIFRRVESVEVEGYVCCYFHRLLLSDHACVELKVCCGLLNGFPSVFFR